MKDQHDTRGPGEPVSSGPASYRSLSGVSRRAFLKGSSAAVAATAMATGAGIAEATINKRLCWGPNPRRFAQRQRQDQRSGRAARRCWKSSAQLNLTGAKPVSVDGSSGASTVIIDGKPAAANIMLAVDCVGKKIRTVESLGGDKPDAVPLAFVHNDAMQCGFCTPGFVVAVRVFLDKNPQATEAEIRQGLNGNLCRCGTYANVIQAALEVVKGGSRG
jgi:xanthine dehydrogenase YagT iron-sulfur-binding subunit